MPPLSSTHSTHATVLIVDSDPFMLTAVAAVLHRDGNDCHCARGAEAALKAVQAATVDLILCDVELSGVSGLELCQEIRGHQQHFDVPVILCPRRAIRKLSSK